MKPEKARHYLANLDGYDIDDVVDIAAAALRQIAAMEPEFQLEVCHEGDWHEYEPWSEEFPGPIGSDQRVVERLVSQPSVVVNGPQV